MQSRSQDLRTLQKDLVTPKWAKKQTPLPYPVLLPSSASPPKHLQNSNCPSRTLETTSLECRKLHRCCIFLTAFQWPQAPVTASQNLISLICLSIWVCNEHLWCFWSFIFVMLERIKQFLDLIPPHLLNWCVCVQKSYSSHKSYKIKWGCNKERQKHTWAGEKRKQSVTFEVVLLLGAL